jgi:cytosine/adenosine deaminase-related metal-dependent hydrolase
MIIKAAWLFNPGEKPLKNPCIEVENGVIKQIVSEDKNHLATHEETKQLDRLSGESGLIDDAKNGMSATIRFPSRTGLFTPTPKKADEKSFYADNTKVNESSHSTIPGASAVPACLPEKSKDIIDLGNSVILPGLVNAHSHLDYAFLNNRIVDGGNFIKWLKEIIKKKNEDGFHKKSSVDAFTRLVKGGVTTIGDVKTAGIGLSVLKEHKGLKGIIFEEFIDPEGKIKESEIEKRINKLKALLDGTVFSAGIMAHSVYSTREQTLIKLHKYAQKNNLPFTIHISESFEETALVKYYTGPLMKISSANPYFGQSLTPVGYLEKIGVLENTILVHAVNLEDGDFNIIAKYRNNIILCPGSNKYLGVGSAPYHRLKGVGSNLSLATDSLASNTILDLRAEAMIAVKEYGIGYDDCFEMITKNPARIMGLNGTITKGKPADIACFKLPEETKEDDDLLKNIFEESVCVLTMVNGDIIYKAAKL